MWRHVRKVMARPRSQSHLWAMTTAATAATSTCSTTSGVHTMTCEGVFGGMLWR